jgi:hypothetical protein
VVRGHFVGMIEGNVRLDPGGQARTSLRLSRSTCTEAGALERGESKRIKKHTVSLKRIPPHHGCDSWVDPGFPPVGTEARWLNLARALSGPFRISGSEKRKKRGGKERATCGGAAVTGRESLEGRAQRAACQCCCNSRSEDLKI